MILAGAAAMIASLGISSGPAHEVVARSRPEPKKRRVQKSPALASPYGTRAERRSTRTGKKHKLKGLRP
ncbi:hypothetical protein [Bradyrhizobium sp. RT10b]|uniref:hypothetical protein n=1 Tax=Bradyrhizobium sp. RT10b TaxID=3156331 RepID=UPI003395CCFC